ncbi:MAG TPA: PadR family transcriptional regulator [Propionibacterium sp.]|nr:PadR family transcriptional regulator [Propionibacterium sp.]
MMNPEPNDMNVRGPRRGRRHEGHGGGHRRGGGRGRGRRAQRGDVRAAILTLLAEEPMHGYHLMQTIAERSEGRWTPSPGAIYPTLSALSDEGLVTLTESDGRKLAELTPAGTEYLESQRDAWPNPFQLDETGVPGVDLHSLSRDLLDAVRHAGRTASEPQRDRLAEVLVAARKDVYRILTEDGDA